MPWRTMIIICINILLAQVIDRTKCVSETPKWFHGARMNYAENLLRYNDNRVALYAASKSHPVSFAPLDHLSIVSDCPRQVKVAAMSAR